MGWFTPGNLAIKNQFTFDGKVYPLIHHKDVDRTHEESKIFVQLNSYINEEIKLMTNVSMENPAYSFVFQLQVLNYRKFAHIDVYDKIIRIFKDTDISLSYERFLDTIQTIYMTVDRRYLLTMKGLFLYPLLNEEILPNDEYTPQEKDWIIVINYLPWIYLMPFISIAVNNNENMLAYRRNVANTLRSNTTSLLAGS
jgi:hypothetical protein